MAAEVEMGEIDDIHSKDGESVLNGDINGDSNSEAVKNIDDSSQEPMAEVQLDDNPEESERMEVDNDEEEDEDRGEDEVDNEARDEESNHSNADNDRTVESVSADSEENAEEAVSEKSELSEDEEDKEDKTEEEEEDDKDSTNEGEAITNGSKNEEVHEIVDDEEDSEEEETEEVVKNGEANENSSEPIELNDSGDGGEGDGDADDGDADADDADGDVMIIDEPKANGEKHKLSTDDLEVIEIDTTPIKDQKPGNTAKRIDLTPRRSVRNMNKLRSYIESDKEEASSSTSEESDIEEVMPQDPLAMNDGKQRKLHANSSTIVVKDTKRLVEIAKSNNANSGNKKEPTLVIIDTNSILSGRGPVPITKSNSNQSYPTILPMSAVPAQGMYPPNMRATITPIPMTSSSSKTSSSLTTTLPSLSSGNATSMAPVLPTLTDDMFVVEAPSFIVPYVYEKPPVSDFKQFIKEMKDRINRELEEAEKEQEKDAEDGSKNEDEKTEPVEDDDVIIDPAKRGYFESPLGKFFIDIGFNLVQEYVQADLLKQQKRKREREGGQNPTTNKTIHSLLKNLEFSKENNEPYKNVMKKCEFCNFKTESKLVMAHHLETPHTKNYVYKCNFCAHEARSPHDILFHTEAEHAVRGRLERAPSFHQCPNCPFEDNQKGKLSRHLVACMRKFKPEKNLEPPIDWEPPAKIPRVPKARQGINVSAYQAMKTQTQQMQFLSKMQLLNTNNTTAQMVQNPMHRGRGRPSMTSTPISKAMLRPSGMVYKQAISGSGPVLMPATYQISGNQVFQVVGGQELSGRLGHPGHMAYVPNLSAATGTVSIQQNQSKNKSVHQPSISITPLPRAASSSSSSGAASSNATGSKPGDINSKNSFVICEICDGYIKDLEQLRNHMQWIHKVKIHPKMIYNRPPLNCQKCQFRFFTDQGLERHLLGSHGLVTSSMQDAANKSKDAGRCPVCGRVYQWKLLNHVARDHNMTLKPAHLSYKCTVCTATFGMYKQFENHVYSAHSVVAKRVMDKKNNSSPANKNTGGDQLMKPLKINDEITIIPQPAKMSSNKDSSPMNSRASTSKIADPKTNSSVERLKLASASTSDSHVKTTTD